MRSAEDAARDALDGLRYLAYSPELVARVADAIRAARADAFEEAAAFVEAYTEDKLWRIPHQKRVAAKLRERTKAELEGK